MAGETIHAFGENGELSRGAQKAFEKFMDEWLGPGAIDATDPAVSLLVSQDGTVTRQALIELIEDKALSVDATDPVVAGFVASASDTQGALDARYATTTNDYPSLNGAAFPGIIRGNPGKGAAFVAGVIRNNDDESGWQLISDGFHPTIGITGVDSLTDTGLIEVTYDGLKIDGTDATRVVSLIAVPDETLAGAGFTVGTSVEPDKARLQLWQARSLSDFLYYDTNDSEYKLWRDEFGDGSPFTIDSTTSNHVTLTHGQGQFGDRFDTNLLRIGGPGEYHLPALSTSEAHTILTQVVVDFYTPTLFGSKGHNWASINDNGSAATGVTVTGCAVGDYASASMDVALPDGMILSAVVTAADTVRVTLFNRTGSTQDLDSGTLRVTTRKADGGDYRVMAADGKCRCLVRRGLVRTYVPPAEVNTTTYPNSNIWILGIMQDGA